MAPGQGSTSRPSPTCTACLRRSSSRPARSKLLLSCAFEKVANAISGITTKRGPGSIFVIIAEPREPDHAMAYHGNLDDMLGGMSLQSNYESERRKSAHIKQYNCTPCNRQWWGGHTNNTCSRCHRAYSPLALEDMLGIGWFNCTDCNRKFAGKAKGDVPSPCNSCHRQLLPEFIVPGSDAARPGGGSSRHNCALCGGVRDCPIAGRIGGRGGRGGRRRY
eukprot:m.90436 g.90436  ORF g.90436 m.90436 type:complete len:220 (+) comp8462_c0_seq1:446-1105(+)